MSDCEGDGLPDKSVVVEKSTVVLDKKVEEVHVVVVVVSSEGVSFGSLPLKAVVQVEVRVPLVRTGLGFHSPSTAAVTDAE